MDGATIIYIVGAILAVAGIMAFQQKGKVLGMGKNLTGFLGLALGLILILGQAGYLADYGVSPFLSAGVVSTGGVVTPSTGGVQVNAYQPTASFAVKDKFSTTAVTGTAYLKTGSLPASITTSATANTNVGETYTYWVSNGTYWVQPLSKVAVNGVTPFVGEAFANGTATVTLYDLVNRQTVSTAGTYNTSMGANKQANIEVSYLGTAKQSAMPFGGVLVVEYNSTIASVSCSGADLLSENPYHLTYTVTSTANTYKTFAVTPSIDSGLGDLHKITCQFQNGATSAGAGSSYYFKLIPANYYVSQAGEILLDTEKFADSSTTRTGSNINLPSAQAYWGA